MRILFLTDNFPPESNAPANRTYEHAREWVNRGVEVTVITCAPNFPAGKIYPGYKNKLWQKSDMDGIQVIRVWSYMASNAGVLRRIVDYVSFGFMAFLASLFVKSDLIIATSPQFFTAVFGYLSAFVKRKPWIMEVRDLWPESIKAVDAIQQNKVINLLESIELFLYRRATRIVVVTDAFKENLRRRGIPTKKIEVVTNGVLLEEYPSMPKSLSLLHAHGLQDKFIVGYMGTHGLAHKLDFIIEAAAKCKDSEVHFVFVGNGAKREELLELKKRLQLKNVSLLPSISKAETKEYISIFDVALVNLRKADTFKTVIPSKIFENAAMGKPILLGLEGESRRIVEKYEAGICFEPENELDFLDKLALLRSDKEKFFLYQQGAKVMAHAYNRKKLAHKLLSIAVSTYKSKSSNVISEKNPSREIL